MDAAFGEKMKTKKSNYFGSWEMRRNGLEQHDLTVKEFMRHENFCKLFQIPVGTQVSKELKKKQLNRMLKIECWYDKNEKYKVVVDNCEYGDINNVVHIPDATCIWLSIRINQYSENQSDKVLRDWREFQEIKNDFAGPESEAMEIYPAESELVDTVNVYHLWCMPEGFGIPFGWHGDRQTNTPKGSSHDQREIRG
jgi:hypothetical protein